MTRTTKTVTAGGIEIETRKHPVDHSISIHRTAEFGDLTVSCMRHSADDTITLNFKRSAWIGDQVYMDMGLLLTPVQAAAIAAVIRGCTKGVADEGARD